MIFRLNIDRDAEESVVATVRQRSALTDRIESLVLQHSGAGRLTGYDGGLDIKEILLNRERI